MVDVTKFSVGDMVTIRAKVTSLENGLIYIGLDNEEINVLESEIIAHEPRSLAQRLAGLTVEQIEAALARKDSGLSEAIEAAGTQIARARRDAGDLKRRPKNTGTGDAGATPPPQAAGEAHPVPTGDDTPAADSGPEPFGGDVSIYRMAEHEAKKGRAHFDKWLSGISILTKEEIREFMPELLGVADSADAKEKAHV
jgi:hypothetical protein